MEIVDITYNFEMYEEIVLNKMKEFNNAVDTVLLVKEVWEGSSRFDNIENVGDWFKNFYQNKIGDNGDVYKIAYEKAREDVKKVLVESLADLNLKKNKMKESFDLLIVLLNSRVAYLEEKYTQDEIYGNYKIRTEVQELKRKIKKYQDIKDSNLKIASEYSLNSFGLEIEDEPDLE